MADQKNNVCGYDLTIYETVNNKLYSYTDIGDMLKQVATKFVFQLEEGEQKKRHFQIRMYAIKKTRPRPLLKLIFNCLDIKDDAKAYIYCQPTVAGVHNKKSFNYVMKAEGRIAGPWTEIDFGEEAYIWIPTALRGITAEHLRPFQRSLLEMSLIPHDRTIDIIYDPSLTLPKLKAEIIKRVRKLGNVGLVIVDYVNQVKRSADSDDKFDWKDQIYVSTALKELAGVLQIPFFSPYQIDAQGEARFAKGILDSADAAFTLEAGPESIQFTCTKIRGDAKIDFNSKVDWNSLRIGPENGVELVVEDDSPPKKRSSFKRDKKEDKPIMDGIYDDPPF